MVAPHLEHRLPWAALGDAIKASRFEEEGRQHKSRTPSPEQLKRVRYFAQCLHTALTEFAATDKSSAEEKAMYDPKTWGAVADSQGYWYLGYYDSIIVGYVELNLLLSDAKALAPIVLKVSGDRLRRTDAMAAMCSDHHTDESDHPEWLGALLQPAFEGDVLKPLTPDVRQILRDHCAKMFKCMYSLLAPSGRIDADYLATRVAWAFAFRSAMVDCLDSLGAKAAEP